MNQTAKSNGDVTVSQTTKSPTTKSNGDVTASQTTKSQTTTNGEGTASQTTELQTIKSNGDVNASQTTKPHGNEVGLSAGFISGLDVPQLVPYHFLPLLLSSFSLFPSSSPPLYHSYVVIPVDTVVIYTRSQSTPEHRKTKKSFPILCFLLSATYQM